MKAEKLYNILKGPYSIIGKSGEYYEVNDISDIVVVFGAKFDNFFTFNIDEFINSKPLKPDVLKYYSFNSSSLFLKKLAYDFIDNDKYFSKELDTIKSISTDLLTQSYFIKTKDSETGEIKKHHFSQRYFFLKHKHFNNEVASINSDVLNVLIHKVARNNKRGFLFFYEKLIVNPNFYYFRISRGSKPSRYRMFQRIKTTQERRWNIAHVDEYGEELVRGKRRKLPNTWDDFIRVNQKSWKQKKIRNQWMKK